jgi:hypothetical protein
MEFRSENRAFVVPNISDMRKQVAGLSGIVQRIANQKEVFDGSYYLFCNNKRNIVKVLYWDFDAFELCQKKSERGWKFHWIEDRRRKNLIEIDPVLARQLVHGVNIWKRMNNVKEVQNKMLPDRETLRKVIAERMASDEYHIKPAYIDSGYGKTNYVDKRGLIHDGGPNGEIIDFIGFTPDQKARLDDMEKKSRGGDSDSPLAPMPR